MPEDTPIITYRSTRRRNTAITLITVTTIAAAFLIANGVWAALVLLPWLIAVLWAMVLWRREFEIDELGVSIRNGFTHRRFAWKEIRGFWVKESRGARGVDAGPHAGLIMWMETDTMWITVDPGDQIPVLAINQGQEIHDTVTELNAYLVRRQQKGIKRP